MQNDSGAIDDDASVPDSGTSPTELVVRAFAATTPLANVPVLFLDSTGEVESSTRTGANGEARAVIAPGTQVTVILDDIRSVYGRADSIQTVYDVSPGDVLTFQTDQHSTEASVVGDVTLTFPGDFPGAIEYSAEINCGLVATSTPSLGVYTELSSGCVGTSTAVAAIGYARDAASNILAFTIADEVTVGPGVTARFPAWRTDFSEIEIRALNVPENSTFALFELDLLRRGIGYRRQHEDIELSTDPFARLSGLPFGDAQRLFVLSRIGGNLVGLEEITPRTDTVDIDLADILPIPRNLTVVSPASTRPIVSWERDSIASVDLVHAYFKIRDGLEWQVWAPPALTMLRFPELPIEYSSYRPSQLGPVVAEYGIGFIDYSDVDSWTELKGRFAEFSLDQSPSFIPKGSPIGTRIRASAGE